MSEEAQQAEIKRLLRFAGATRSNPFAVLNIDMENDFERVQFSEVSKTYRRITLLVHPDKCSLPHASDAFHVAEQAYKMVNEEVVFERLRDAYRKKKEKENETHIKIGPSKGWGAKNELPPIQFGSLCQLAAEGASTEEQIKAEIARVLACKPNDYFFVLDIDPSGGQCDVGNITKKYRFMAKSLHPDKCTAEGVKDAFIVVEKAYRELSDEKKLVRYKAGFEQQRKRQAAEAARQGSSTGGFSGVLSDAERKELALKNMLREQQLRSARLAEEEDRKRERDHQKKTSEEELNVELKRQKKEWDSMKLF